MGFMYDRISSKVKMILIVSKDNQDNLNPFVLYVVIRYWLNSKDPGKG